MRGEQAPSSECADARMGSAGQSEENDAAEKAALSLSGQSAGFRRLSAEEGEQEAKSEPGTAVGERERNRRLYEAACLAEAAGDLNGALHNLRQVSSRPGEDVAVHFRIQSLLWRLKAEEQVSQARAAMAAKRWREAATAAESALQRWPEVRDAEQIRNKALGRLRRGRILRLVTTVGALVVVAGLAASSMMILEGGQASGTPASPTPLGVAEPPASSGSSAAGSESPTAPSAPILTATENPTVTPTSTSTPTKTPEPTATATRTATVYVAPTRTPTRRPPTNTPAPPKTTGTATAVATKVPTTGTPTVGPTSAATGTPTKGPASTPTKGPTGAPSSTPAPPTQPTTAPATPRP